MKYPEVNKKEVVVCDNCKKTFDPDIKDFLLFMEMFVWD